jgi:hypothetical protein
MEDIRYRAAHAFRIQSRPDPGAAAARDGVRFWGVFGVHARCEESEGADE